MDALKKKLKKLNLTGNSSSILSNSKSKAFSGTGHKLGGASTSSATTAQPPNVRVLFSDHH